MELLFLVILFFLRSSHYRGFSHCEQEGWNSLFVIADQEGLDIFIDGCPTGLQAPGRIFIEPSKHVVSVELRRAGQSLYSNEVNILEKNSFVLGQVCRSLHLFA